MDSTVSPPNSSSASIKVGLSTSSVYPEKTDAGFRIASELGYDGIEVMVGIDPMAADIDVVEKLRDEHQVPVLAIHAPCLLVTQQTWGRDAWSKLERSGEAAVRLGADVVVVHPPFRWQGAYARGFVDGIRSLNERFDVKFCVENMYPWRTPGSHFQAYLPDWDPTDEDYDHLTLDLSHAATAHRDSLELARAWGGRLSHVHLTDGRGSLRDEHLLPGQGTQPVWELLEHLARTGYSGHVVLEANTRRYRSSRGEVLGQVLAEIRRRLGQA